MRIVTKINTALGALIGLSVLLNWGALEFTVKPSFADLEERTARDNHGRVLEALSRLQEQARGSARDYAVWDDTYAFMNGEQPGLCRDEHQCRGSPRPECELFRHCRQFGKACRQRRATTFPARSPARCTWSPPNEPASAIPCCGRSMEGAGRGTSRHRAWPRGGRLRVGS